jgi:hypothetical protein
MHHSSAITHVAISPQSPTDMSDRRADKQDKQDLGYRRAEMRWRR